MTKSLREGQMKEKMDRYPKVSTSYPHTITILFYLSYVCFKCTDFCLQVVLRVQFPDRHVLQGFFRPLETGVCLFMCVCVCSVASVHFSWLATGMAAMLKLLAAPSPHV